MSLDFVKRSWNTFGKRDPMWAILTDPTKKDGGWSPDDFFRTGRELIGEISQRVEGLDLEPGRERALDFGCGVGRLTQALAERFDQVVGVDIAASMIQQARQLNRHGDRVDYRLNTGPRLEGLADGSFDLVCSFITLQHMPPQYALGYLKELLRVSRPGGVLVFQFLTERIDGVTPGAVRARSWLRRLFSPESPQMEMHGMPRDAVDRCIAEAGATVVDALDRSWSEDWYGFEYVVRR